MSRGLGPTGPAQNTFFNYSSPILYKSSVDLALISRRELGLGNPQIIVNYEKMAKTFLLILLAIVIKSICQYYLGAEQTSLNKILLVLDHAYYEGAFLGGSILIFIQDNWKNILDYLKKPFIIKFYSGDENSRDEGLSVHPDVEQSVLISIAAGEMAENNKDYIKNVSALSQQVKNFSNLEMKGWNVHNAQDANKAFIPLLQEHAKMFREYCVERQRWLITRAHNLEPQNKILVYEAIAKIHLARDKYNAALEPITSHSDPSVQIKIFYAALNEQRNLMNKEFNKADDIIYKDLKKSPFCTGDHEDSKTLVRTLTDYTKAKIEFNKNDSNLKKKIGELIQKKK